MPRKPLGERAMTDAERQRRRRARLKAAVPLSDAEMKREIELQRHSLVLDALRGQIRQLELDLKQAHRERDAARERVRQLEMELEALRRQQAEEAAARRQEVQECDIG